MKKLYFYLSLIACVFLFNSAMAADQHTTIVKTANDTGWTFNGVYDFYSKAYVNFASQDPYPTLELGAGRGATAAELLNDRMIFNNQAKITVNDISSKHLEEALLAYPTLKNENISLLPGRFPEDISFKKNSFNSILASRFFHFLTPDQWRVGLKKIYSWLMPGGRLYITTGSYFIANQKNNLNSIEMKKKSGNLWPAIFKNGQEAYGGNSKSGPATLVDKDMLIRELELAGFKVIKIEYIDGRKLLPANFCLDGREGVGAIAIKPLN